MEWISVKERSPEDSGCYLVRTTLGDTEVAEYHTADYMMDDYGVRQWYMQKTDIEHYVTHWMPLPEPPNPINI